MHSGLFNSLIALKENDLQCTKRYQWLAAIMMHHDLGKAALSMVKCMVFH